MSATTIASVLEDKEVQDRVGAELLAQAFPTIAVNPQEGTEDQQLIRYIATVQVQAESVHNAPVYAAQVVRYLCATEANFKTLDPTAITDAMIEAAITAFYASADGPRYVQSIFSVKGAQPRPDGM